MKLRKRVPASSRVLEISNIKLDFMTMSQTFREIRAKSKNPMDKCHWCKEPFADGDMMALAICHTSGNKVLCQACAAMVET